MNNRDDVIHLYKQLLTAWNQKDASAMAALFTEKGGQVGFDGSAVNGATAIEEHLASIFKDHPTQKFVAKVREVRQIGEGVVLLRAEAGMVPPNKTEINPDMNTIQTLIASCQSGGSWKVEMFHNTPAAFHGREDERQKLTQELQEELRERGTVGG